MEFEIRLIELGDLRESKGFFETLSNLSPIEPLDYEKSVEILHNMLLQGSKLFVAKTPNGTIIGCATLLVEQKFNRGGGLAGHIEDVSTRKGYEGQGVGRTLVSACVEEAKKAGCCKVILDCADRLVPFYEKNSFKVHGIEMRLDL